MPWSIAAFCMVIASVTNLKRLRAAHAYSVTDGALTALVKRIHGVVGKDAMIGRWTEDEFAVLLELDPAHAMAVSAEISKDLSARYVVQHEGVSHSLTLYLNTSIADRPAGGDPAKFREKLAMLRAARHR